MAAPLRCLMTATALAAVVVACGGEPGTTPTTQSSETAAAAEGRGGRSHPAEGTAPDLILITIDTLRADALGFAGNERVKTPLIDRLAAEGRVFPHAHAHNVVTLPSHTNILTGLFPYQHGVRDNSGFVLGDDVPTLATELSRAGYATAAFVAAYPLDERFGLARGFDLYDDDYPQGTRPTDFVMPERRGDEVVERALAWWRSQAGERRFLWVHLYDPHAPYLPPVLEQRDYADAPYLGEVAAVDRFLTPLLEPLLDGEGEPTVVAFTADHGEALGDHGELTHGLFAYEPTLHVPLVLWGTGVEPGSDERWVGHVDLLPTLLAAAGVEAPAGLPGRSLLDDAPLAGRDLYFEALSTFLNRNWAPLHGLLRGPDKLIQLPVPELYDLAEDPAEAVNRVDGERRLFAELRRSLPEAALRPPERQEISSEEARRLAALGYLGGGGGGTEREFTVDDDPKNLVEVDRDVHRTVMLYSEGRLAEAEAVARQVVAARPSMALAYEHLATVLREQGKLNEAVKVLEQGMAEGIQHPSLIRLLGTTLAEAGRGREAVELLEGRAASDDLDDLNALGLAFYGAGRLADAQRVLDRVLSLDAENAKALETLTGVALAAGQPAVAQSYAERALAVNDELPLVWNNLGVASAWQGNTERAMEAWQRAVELNPDMLDALYNLGLTAFNAGRAELARRALTDYVAKAPPSAAEDVREARGILAQLEGRR